MNCTRVRENLNRFLDNDLAAKEATDCASHLEICVGCRHAYEQMGTVRTSLRSLPSPSTAIMDAARVRAFDRLESRLQAEVKQRGWPALRQMLSAPVERYPVSLAFFAAAGGVAGVLLLLMIQESPIQNALRPTSPSETLTQPR